MLQDSWHNGTLGYKVKSHGSFAGSFSISKDTPSYYRSPCNLMSATANVTLDPSCTSCNF
eukprot:1148251-Pelagomonas_calceolata.AAC.17